MKAQIKSAITLGLIMTGLLFSCKHQDGYSDEVHTNQNPGNATNETVNDTIGGNNSSLGTDVQPAGAQSTGSQSTNSGVTNSGSGNSNSKGTGNGPGPDPKDGAVYTPSSDPKQITKKDTIKKVNKN
ncbi:MAG TPA: hypothetical protein VF465_12695 [Flavobacterium sp.]|uniref:hypothetical protein n=1 Tax=Flavobacterium sp. TaxID=239 RepID=UPI002ED0AFA1